MVNTILTPDQQALAAEHDAQPVIHHAPQGLSDRFALGFTKRLRFTADTFFAKRYGHRAIVLETVAAVPGMVGAMFTHPPHQNTPDTTSGNSWGHNRGIQVSPRLCATASATLIPSTAADRMPPA